MSNDQLDLFDWKPPAEIVPFPMARSHGLTAGTAKSIIDLDKPARTGKLNSIRAKTRKRLEPLFGRDLANRMADELIRQIKLQITYRENERGFRRPDEA